MPPEFQIAALLSAAVCLAVAGWLLWRWWLGPSPLTNVKHVPPLGVTDGQQLRPVLLEPGIEWARLSHVQVIRYEPGDVIVLKQPPELNAPWQREAIEQWFPGCRVLVLHPDAEIAVVRARDWQTEAEVRRQEAEAFARFERDYLNDPPEHRT